MLQFSCDVGFNESQSDLVKLHAHRQSLSNFLIMHDVIYYYLLFQITN